MNLIDTLDKIDFIGRAVDRINSKLGYLKAADIPKMARILAAGEAVDFRTDFMTQTEEEIQKLAITNPWVYSNVMLIAKRIADGIIGVQERDKEDEWQWIPGHDLTRLFEERPNPFMGQSFIWIYQMIWLLLKGECYWMLVPSVSGELTQIYPLPANRLEPVSSKESFISHFLYRATATGREEPIPVENILFIRLPNPFMYHRGLSPLSAYLMGLQLDKAVQKFDLDDYKQGLTLRHIVSLRPELSDVDAYTVQADFDEAQKAQRRYIIIRGGDMDVAPVTVRRGAEEESASVRQMTKLEADYIYGIPEGLRVSSATQANATVAERTFRSDTIWPLMVLISEDVTVQVVRRYYEDGQRTYFEDIRIADREQQITDENHEAEAMTLDEVRAQRGLDPYWDEEIGKQKYTAVDELIKMAFQQGSTEEGISEAEEEEIPIPEAFLEEDEAVTEEGKSELAYWVEQGWIDFTDGKHSAHDQRSHGRRFSGSGSSRVLVSGKDDVSQKLLGKQKKDGKKPKPKSKKGKPPPSKPKVQPKEKELTETNKPKRLTKTTSAASLRDEIDETGFDIIKEEKITNQVLGKVPAWHLDTGEGAEPRLKEIAWGTRRKVNLERDKVASGRKGNVAGFAQTDTKTGGRVMIEKGVRPIRTHGGSKQTLAHEIGHVVFQRNIKGDKTQNFQRSRATFDRMGLLYGFRDKQFGKGNWAHKTVSSYATTKQKEFVAEIYAKMVTNPKKLFAQDPEAYNVMIDMFK